MSILWVINGILLVIVLAMVFNELYLKIMVKRSAKMLTEEEFKETMRKAQVIDVREKVDYDYGHINGARNIPISMFSQRYQGLRKDQPVYLYDQKKALSIRAANLLRKNGYTDIYILKGGYDGWTGKVKKRNS